MVEQGLGQIYVCQFILHSRDALKIVQHVPVTFTLFISSVSGLIRPDLAMGVRIVPFIISVSSYTEYI